MNHRNLRCYAMLLDVAKHLPTLIGRMPKGNANLADQLKRALESSILNLSEGNSRTSQKERNRFFDISLGSLAEVDSCIDIMSSYGYLPASMEASVKAELTIIFVMIRRLKK